MEILTARNTNPVYVLDAGHGIDSDKSPLIPLISFPVFLVRITFAITSETKLGSVYGQTP